MNCGLWQSFICGKKTDCQNDVPRDRIFSLFALISYPEKSQEKREERRVKSEENQKEKPHFRVTFLFGEDKWTRTIDLLHVKQAL